MQQRFNQPPGVLTNSGIIVNGTGLLTVLQLDPHHAGAADLAAGLISIALIP